MLYNACMYGGDRAGDPTCFRMSFNVMAETKLLVLVSQLERSSPSGSFLSSSSPRGKRCDVSLLQNVDDILTNLLELWGSLLLLLASDPAGPSLLLLPNIQNRDATRVTLPLLLLLVMLSSRVCCDC